MSIIKKILSLTIILSVALISKTFANDLKKIGKYKDWEVMVVSEQSGKVCFAQSIPVLQAPKSNKRDARLFVTFRPGENIKDEVSLTSGHIYKTSSVVAASGKSNFNFFSQNNFAWLLDEREEKNFIKLMKRATNLIVKAKTQEQLNQFSNIYLNKIKKNIVINAL